MDLVLDATELLPALVSRGRRRALLALCRYGRASLVQLTYGGAGFESLAEHGEPAGPLAETLRGAENEIAFFEARLPASAPDDTHLVLSEPLLDEVQRKLIERFNLDAREALIQKHRLATLAVRFASLPQELPRLASDPGDDHIAATAIYGRAEAIVTSERQLLEDRSYELQGRTVEVFSFDEYASRIETSTFSLSQVPEILSIPTQPGLPKARPRALTRTELPCASSVTQPHFGPTFWRECRLDVAVNVAANVATLWALQIAANPVL